MSTPSLAALMRGWRDRALLTQEQLASRSGLGLRTIRRLETGGDHRPRASSVGLLADALGLSSTERAQLVDAAGPVPVDPPGAPATSQLPPPPRHLVGREDLLAGLTAALDRAGTGDAAEAMIVAVGGAGGIGKTAFAVSWAHRVAARFPDGQLYVNLRGFDPSGAPMTPGEAIRGFLDAFAVPAARIPTRPDALTGLYRSLLAGRRLLILLDNAADADQVRPLLPGGYGCLVVVTSRDALTGLVATQGALPVVLDPLSAETSRELLVRYLGADRTAAEPAAVDGIVSRCGGLPLALAVVAARAARQPAQPLAAFAAELADTRLRLDALDGGDRTTQARAVFSWSYRRLRPAAARLFRLLGIHPSPDLTLSAAASLAGSPIAATRRAGAELDRAHLIVAAAPWRLGCHDLLRTYAGELARIHDSASARHQAIGRTLDHYLHTADAAATLLYPHRDPLVLPRRRWGVVLEDLPDRAGAIDWFVTECPSVLAAVECAADAGFHDHTWQLLSMLTQFLSFRRAWPQAARAFRAAVAVLPRITAVDSRARAHLTLALIGKALGEPRAPTHYGHALALFGETGDLVGQAAAHRGLTGVMEAEGRWAPALEHARQALALYRAAGHRTGEALSLNAVGWCHARLGEYRDCISHCTLALVLHDQTGNRLGAAATHHSIGYASHHLDRPESAVYHLQRALDLYRDLGNRAGEVESLILLGHSRRAAGDDEAASRTWTEALSLLDGTGHADADRLRALLRSAR
jgi:tetratricopeptide (TPR) repeat protein/transcriptional regulator with XRE-family HTH domain